MADEVATSHEAKGIEWRRGRWWLLGLNLWMGAAMLPLAIALGLVARAFPDITEQVYGRQVYPLIGGTLSSLTGLIAPVSVAELLTIIVLIAISLWSIHAMKLRRASGRRLIGLTSGWWKRGPARALAFLGFAAMSFQLLWGLNYQRPGIAVGAGFAKSLEEQQVTASELRYLADGMIRHCEILRISAVNHRASNPTSREELFRIAAESWRFVRIEHPELSEYGSEVKIPMISPILDRLGIAGMYWPFTGEANVSSEVPFVMAPFVAGHEQAHQRGVTGEDEANWMGWKVCSASTNPQVAYSGQFSALVYVIGALRQTDPEAYAWILQHDSKFDESLRHKLKPIPGLTPISPSVWQDLSVVREWQNRHKGTIQNVRRAVNDVYLKAHGTEGMVSYGRMVELLVARMRQELGVRELPSIE